MEEELFPFEQEDDEKGQRNPSFSGFEKELFSIFQLAANPSPGLQQTPQKPSMKRTPTEPISQPGVPFEPLTRSSSVPDLTGLPTAAPPASLPSLSGLTLPSLASLSMSGIPMSLPSHPPHPIMSHGSVHQYNNMYKALGGRSISVPVNLSSLDQLHSSLPSAPHRRPKSARTASSTKLDVLGEIPPSLPASPLPSSPIMQSSGLSSMHTPSKSVSPPPDDYDSEDDGKRPKGEGKLQKRLARKAELARASRKRKKLYIQDLETKVANLTKQVESLQQKHASAVAAETSKEQAQALAQKEISLKLKELISQPIPEKNSVEIGFYLKKHAAIAKERQQAVEHHLERALQYIVPQSQVKFALWSLDQDEEFYQKPDGLWQAVMGKEVGLTPGQMAALRSRREAIRKERIKLRDSERSIKTVLDQVKDQCRSLNKEMDEIQKVMTPVQLSRFQIWIDNNAWCMQMLNTLFSNS